MCHREKKKYISPSSLVSTHLSVTNGCMECPRRQRLLCFYGAKGHAQCLNCPRSHHYHSLGCKFRISCKLVGFSSLRCHPDRLVLISAGGIRRPCPPVLYTPQGHLLKMNLVQMIMLASLLEVALQQTGTHRCLPILFPMAEAGLVQMVSSLLTHSQNSPYARLSFSTGSPPPARLSIAPTIVSCQLPTSWVVPFLIL
jgi:hypothetical protein